MKESDYINATNLAKVRMAREIIRDVLPDGTHLTNEEQRFLMRATDAWQARLERAISPEIREDNKERWRIEWPKA